MGILFQEVVLEHVQDTVEIDLVYIWRREREVSV